MNTTKHISKFRYKAGKLVQDNDLVVVEQPLQIVISDTHADQKPIIYSITYRTPGDDESLILGLLLAEGVIKTVADVEHLEVDDEDTNENRWHVYLNSQSFGRLERTQQFQPTYSSCGLCGTTSIQQFETKHDIQLPKAEGWLTANDLTRFSARMKSNQHIFKVTGGVHAACLFDEHGEILALKEDIGRHNALDKLVGEIAKTKGKIQCENTVLVISSRISLEMVQKTLVAGIPVLVAVGGASSLAIDAANRFGLTLIGFVSTSGFNVYSGHQRLSV